MKLNAQAHYYAILGVTKHASESELKRAYRAAAKSYHPDLPSNAGDVDAATRFREINEAYEVLSDPRKRLLYDNFGKKGLTEAYKDWQPSSPRRGGKRRKREHEGTEVPSTDAGSGVASIFEDLFASAVPTGPAKKRNENLWNPAGLDMGPVDEPVPLTRSNTTAGQQRQGGSPDSASTGGGRFGPGGFKMSYLKECLKAAAGYGGMSEGGGDKSDGPMPSWIEGMMGGPVDEGAFAQDRGNSMPRFQEQGHTSPPPQSRDCTSSTHLPLFCCVFRECRASVSLGRTWGELGVSWEELEVGGNLKGT